MAKSFNGRRPKLSPERQQRNEEAARSVILEMTLFSLCQRRGARRRGRDRAKFADKEIKIGQFRELERLKKALAPGDRVKKKTA